MKKYSRQLDSYIDCVEFALSYCRPTDQRTNVMYYKASDGLIHSSSFNYSLISLKPLTIEQFIIKVKDNITITVEFL